METALIAIVLLAVTLITIWLMNRANQSAVRRVLSGERTLDDKDIFLRKVTPLPARVLEKKETLNPKAKGIVKVDLRLEIAVPEKDPMQVNTTWLVEIASLRDLQEGKEVLVKFDPDRPERVYPAVAWARLWVF